MSSLKEEPPFFHLVFSTHNTRYSKRMTNLKITTGPPLLFTVDDEIIVAKCMKQVILDEKIACHAFNICEDHVHLLIQSEVDELSNSVKRLKGKSSYTLNKHRGRKGMVWSQKYYVREIDVKKLSTIHSSVAIKGFKSELENVILYIKDNRIKHNLEYNIKLYDVIESITGYRNTIH